MKKTELATVVSVLLGEKAVACEDCGANEVLVKLADINQEINRNELCTYLYEELLTQDYEEIEFDFYDNDDALIVSAIKIRNEYEETRLTITVLSHFGQDVVEYENIYPDSISIRLESGIEQDERISICNELTDILKMYDFEISSFEDDGNWLTIFAKDTIDHCSKNSILTTIVLTLLQDMVEEYKEFGRDMIAVNVPDCNMRFQDKEMTIYLRDALLLQGFTDIKFTIYQDSSFKSYWLIVEAQEPQDDVEELSRLAFLVLTLLGNNVYEYGQFYPDSTSIQLFDWNKKINGKKVYEFLKDVLELKGYKDIGFCRENGNWLTVFATEPEFTTTADLATVVLALLGDDLFGCKKIAPGFFEMKLKDSKKKYCGKDVNTYLMEVLKLFGYKELRFNFDDDNWLTIIAKQPQTI